MSAVEVFTGSQIPLTILVYLCILLWCKLMLDTEASIIRPSQKAQILLLTLIVTLSYMAQAAHYFVQGYSGSDWQTSDLTFVHPVGLTLAWSCLGLAIMNAKASKWHPYLWCWSSTFIYEMTFCVLALLRYHNQKYERTIMACQALRITSTALLTARGYSLVLLSEVSSDEKRQPPLHSDNDQPQANNEDDGTIKNQQRTRLQEEGFIGYVRSFFIFLPYVWPRKNMKIKACIVFLVIHIIADRFLNVLVPRQVGIITNELEAAPGNMPWRAILNWLFLSWLNSWAGLDLIKNIALTEIRHFSQKGISKLAFRHVMSLSFDFHNDKDSAEVIKAVEQSSSMNQLMESVLLDIGPLIFDLIFAVWFVSHLFGLYLAMAALAIGLIYAWIGIVFTQWTKEQRRAYAASFRAQGSVMHQSIENWRTVKYFNCTEYENKRQEEVVGTMVTARTSFLHRAYVGYAAQALLMTIGLTSCVCLAIREIIVQGKPIGSLVTFLLYWSTLMFPLQRMAWSYRDLTSTLIDTERLVQLLRTRPSIKEVNNCPDLRVNIGAIEFRNVRFSYHPGKEVLRGINFSISPGQKVAVVGESGGGKSTLFNLLYRFIDPTEGVISIDGQDLRDVSVDSVQRAIGIVPQDPTLFNRSILENVRYANLDAKDGEVYEACELAAIHCKIMSLPAGYDSKVGEKGVRLSGGERQRLAIARVILHNPSIVLLDEATSAVDSSTEAKIQDAFRSLGSGRTMLVIAHRLSTIADADQIFVMADGDIIEIGTHQELLQRGGQYARLWADQAGTMPPSSQEL